MMTAAGMAQKVVNKIKTLNPEITGQAEVDLLAAWEKICEGLLEEITTNATVTGTAAVTTAPGTAPVTGTIA